MAYLDLAEVPELLRTLKLLGKRQWSATAFLEQDHRIDTGQSLDDEIRACVERETHQTVDGPIRLLTLLRTWGYYFSPLNLYYCFAPDGERVTAIVAEVSNMPWLETHRYVLAPLQATDQQDFAYEHDKGFHVSPFMAMNMRYRWRCSSPDEELAVKIASQQAGETLFTAHMELTRRSFSDRELARSLCRYPLMTARVVAAIYWQALRLWWKKCPFHTHPKKRSLPGRTSPR